MKLTHHVILSTGVTSVFAACTKSWPGSAACFLSGIFIDLDHNLDYLIWRRELPISYRKLIDFLKNDHDAKLYLFLHSYELLALLWFSVFYFNLNAVWLGLAVGVSAHMACDEYFNPLRPLAYFLLFRYSKDFCRRRLFKKGYLGSYHEDD